jgi:hypothetical protein
MSQPFTQNQSRTIRNTGYTAYRLYSIGLYIYIYIYIYIYSTGAVGGAMIGA